MTLPRDVTLRRTNRHLSEAFGRIPVRGKNPETFRQLRNPPSETRGPMPGSWELRATGIRLAEPGLTRRAGHAQLVEVADGKGHVDEHPRTLTTAGLVPLYFAATRSELIARPCRETLTNTLAPLGGPPVRAAPFQVQGETPR